MDLLARWITKTEELEEALEGTLDTDERLAEYADAVSRVRDEAVRYRNAYRGAVDRIAALERQLVYAIDALEGLPTAGWNTDSARDVLGEFDPATDNSRGAVEEIDRLKGLLTLWANFASDAQHIVPGPNGKTLGELTRDAFGGQ